MFKLILAAALTLVVLTGCSSNSVPKGFYMSPFIIIDSGESKTKPAAPVKESRVSKGESDD